MELYEEVEGYKREFEKRIQWGYLITEIKAKHFELPFYEPIMPFSETINHNHVPEDTLSNLNNIARGYNLSESFEEKFGIAKKAVSEIEKILERLN